MFHYLVPWKGSRCWLTRLGWVFDAKACVHSSAVVELFFLVSKVCLQRDNECLPGQVNTDCSRSNRKEYDLRWSWTFVPTTSMTIIRHHSFLCKLFSLKRPTPQVPTSKTDSSYRQLVPTTFSTVQNNKMLSRGAILKVTWVLCLTAPNIGDFPTMLVKCTLKSAFH